MFSSLGAPVTDVEMGNRALMPILDLTQNRLQIVGDNGLARPRQSVPSISGKLMARVQQEPFNAAATIIFFLAITHTILTFRFQQIAHEYDVKVRAKGNVDPPSPFDEQAYPRPLLPIEVQARLDQIVIE